MFLNHEESAFSWKEYCMLPWDSTDYDHLYSSLEQASFTPLSQGLTSHPGSTSAKELRGAGLLPPCQAEQAQGDHHRHWGCEQSLDQPWLCPSGAGVWQQQGHPLQLCTEQSPVLLRQDEIQGCSVLLSAHWNEAWRVKAKWSKCKQNILHKYFCKLLGGWGQHVPYP